MLEIEYRTNVEITVEEFLNLLIASTLGERRPVEDRVCIEGMLNNSNLIVSTWHGQKLVGIARSITDFHFACYLSDLAVDRTYQRQGVGLRLQQIT